jgi:hypothetical protein
MSRFGSFFLGVLTGAALLHVAMNFHVVRASDGFHFVAKQPARLSEVYADVRQYSMSDWSGHPQLASDLVQAGKQGLISGSATNAIEEGLNQLAPSWPKQ